MPFTEDEIAQHLETLETEFWIHRRPPLHLRDKIREGQRIEKQDIILYFQRPAFQRPGEWIEESIAKIRYVRTQDVWKLYWQRADMNWHRYEPCPEAAALSEALAVINEDAYCCFFG